MVMTVSIPFVVAVVLSGAAMWWCSSFDYGGQYDFTGPFMIAIVWLVYFALRAWGVF